MLIVNPNEMTTLKMLSYQSGKLVLLYYLLFTYLGSSIILAQQSESAVEFRRLERWYCGSYEQRMMLVVRNERDWEKLKSKVSFGSIAKTVSSPMDFRASMLIAVYQGRRPSSGYSIKVTRVIEYAEAIKVIVEEESPGRGCIETDAITTPCEMIEMKRTNKIVRFEIKQRTKRCEQ